METFAEKNGAKLLPNVGEIYRHYRDHQLDMEIVDVYTDDSNDLDRIWVNCRRLDKPDIVEKLARFQVEDFYQLDNCSVCYKKYECSKYEKCERPDKFGDFNVEKFIKEFPECYFIKRTVKCECEEKTEIVLTWD